MVAALGRVDRELQAHGSMVCLQHLKEMVKQETKEFEFTGILSGNQARICTRIEPKSRPIQTSPSVRSINSLKRDIRSPMNDVVSKKVRLRKMRIISDSPRTPSIDTDKRS